MPPKITSVKWRCNGWLPEGVLFDENTGTFTGTPSAEDIGEFVVPVTVKTNYGTDTKDVRIIVEPPMYGVYAMGAKAKTWSGKSVPDADGLYGLSIPKMEKLSSWAGGFRAYRTSGDIYGCGVINSWYGKYTGPDWETKDTPYKIGAFSPSSSPIKCWCNTGSSGSAMSMDGKTSVYVMATMTEDGHISIKNNAYYTILMNGVTSETYSGKVSGSPKPSDASVLGVGITSSLGGMRWLSEDGTKRSELSYSINTSTNTATPSISTYNIGYKAVKLLSPCTFSFLSENMLLDNKASNFTHGTIKDVWGYNKIVYVQTTENELYEYVFDSKTWNLLGTYDIKKAEVTAAGNLFMLTNDGKLYHKGNAITGLFTKAQNTLTEIAISAAVIDFAFGGDTLTLLKE